MAYNFVADGFHTRNFVANFLRQKCTFRWERPFCILSHLLGLGATYVVRCSC